MKQILVKTSWDCPYNDNFQCRRGDVSECCETNGAFPVGCRLQDAPLEIVETKPKLHTTANIRH